MYDLKKTDPEFAERFEHFAFDEVVNEAGQQLEAPVRYLAVLAALLGCACQRQYESWQRQGLPDARYFPVPAVYRLPAQPQRYCLHKQGRGGISRRNA